MRKFFQQALENITKYGDTDIFPFPVESHVFFDKMPDIVTLLLDIDVKFDERLAESPPANYSALAPAGYTGFRWATQLDSLWNAYFLGIVLSISDEIERVRIAKSRNIVFSYRFSWNENSKELFNREYNWRTFMEHSLILAKECAFVVTCDISEFYSRLNHHRLENALKHLDLKGNQTSRIMEFLKNFSGTYSVGMPVGGPAARILSELYLNQVDQLLALDGIKFCRFADDYHIFCSTYEDAFRALVFLSEKLLRNLVLQLQKSKTRILSGQEFIATSPLGTEDEAAPADRESLSLKEQSQNLLRFSVRFDPYSPTAAEDYEVLKEELKKFDIIALLKSELAKSRIHISLSKKIVSAIRFINASQRNNAVVSLIKNAELLYPIYANVLYVTKALFSVLSQEAKDEIIEYIRQLIRTKSHVVQVELNLAFAVRLLSCEKGGENQEILNNIYRETSSIAIRRDIILAMARWKAWPWLSDLRNNFRTLSQLERRAFVIASYELKDEGDHWRQHVQPELSPIEKLIQKWASEKVADRTWSPPL
jgi:hypothetical protein